MASYATIIMNGNIFHTSILPFGSLDNFFKSIQLKRCSSLTVSSKFLMNENGSRLCGYAGSEVKHMNSLHFTTNTIGGEAQWYIPHDQRPNLCCLSCGANLRCLCQIYAPLDGSPWHRILYVFFCATTACQQGQVDDKSWVKVFRCQFAEEGGEKVPDSVPTTVQPATSSGIQDMAVEEHEGPEEGPSSPASSVDSDELFSDWPGTSNAAPVPVTKSKRKPQKTPCSGAPSAAPSLEWRMFFMDVYDDEDPQPEDEDNSTTSSVQKVEVDSSDVEDNTEECFEDQTLHSLSDYLLRLDIQGAPYRPVLLYHRGGESLMVDRKRAANLDSLQIPKCGRCGASRVFEFQVLPTVNNYLQRRGSTEVTWDADFQNVAVFTCSKSCGPGPCVVEEFALLE